MNWHVPEPLRPVRAESGVVAVPVATAVGALLAAYGLAMLVVAVPASLTPPNVLTAPIVVFAVVFVPGALAFLSLSGATPLFGFRDRPLFDARFVTYSVGISLVLIMAVGLIINITLPAVGVPNPMDVGPLAVSLSAVVIAIAAATLVGRRSTLFDAQRGPRFPALNLRYPVVMAYLLLPASSILAVEFLDHTQNNLPIIAVLVVIGVVPLVTVFFVDERFHAFGLWAMAIAVLYHKSLSLFSGFSGSPGVIRAWLAHRWTPGVDQIDPFSTELLQNGVLFPAIAQLVGIDIMTELEVVNPFLVSFIPVAMFLSFRRYTGSRTAFLGAAVFVFAHPFFTLYPNGGRAATPVLFLAMFGLVVSEDRLDPMPVMILRLAFAAGIIVTHYGTTYYVMGAMIGALIVLTGIRTSEWLLEGSLTGLKRDDEDRLQPSTAIDIVRSEYNFAGSAVSGSFVLFYSVGAIGWYFYTTGGQKFAVLPRHAARSLGQLTEGQVGTGRTTARLTRDYGTTSIRLAKIVYLILGILIMVGLMVTLYRRLVSSRSTEFDDPYLAMAYSLLAIFGMTILVRNWGGGRPMMITFTFTTVFAVVGIKSIISIVTQFISTKNAGRAARRAATGISIVLIVLFLLNSGVMAAVVFGGKAPSGVPLQPRTLENNAMVVFKGQDVQAHSWLHHYKDRSTVYGDLRVKFQQDWYAPAISLEAGLEGNERWGPFDQITAVREGNPTGYVFLLGTNTVNNELSIGGSIESESLSAYRPRLRQRHKVYTTGASVIYYGAAPQGNESRNNI